MNRYKWCLEKYPLLKKLMSVTQVRVGSEAYLRCVHPHFFNQFNSSVK